MSSVSSNRNDVVDICCMDLIGAIIKQAIKDCMIETSTYGHGKYNNVYNKYVKKDAHDFLFTGDRLRNFLSRFNVDTISVDYIRNMARKIISGEQSLDGEIDKKNIENNVYNVEN